ncbi:MAG: TIGR04255 family protein [Egibacteraceae bacterium]
MKDDVIGMPPRPDDLPEFDRPPLVEVALTAGFPPQLRLRQAHLGVIWTAFRDEYPVVQDHPPLDRMVAPPGPGFTINITNAPPLHRAWFLSPGGDKLIQVQSDRFVANWRITPDSSSRSCATSKRASSERMSSVGETIADNDELLRRVHPNNGLIRDANTGGYRVSTAALRDPEGRGEISVYATRLLPEGQGPPGPGHPPS